MEHSFLISNVFFCHFSFNQLELHKTYDKLRTSLLKAIPESSEKDLDLPKHIQEYPALSNGQQAYQKLLEKIFFRKICNTHIKGLK